ncbi:MAG: glycosyltransferase [Rhodospirillales bacterium]
MARARDGSRLLIYSHDSFGLGHLRRCRTIAHSLVANRSDLSILILSGSPIIGSFDFRTRVDFVRIPGVIKLRHGAYTTLSLEMDVDETVALREGLIRHTAEMFEPDLFLVDKEPLGLRGEVKQTLELMKSNGVPTILGLRDVLDEPGQLSEEWERKNVVPAIRDLYDHIWVYGLEDICDPLAGIQLPAGIREKTTYTGYLRRHWDSMVAPPLAVDGFDPGRPYVLVTTGGGGDGATLIEWVLRAYEHDPSLQTQALLVLGPFMHSNLQSEFMARVAALPTVHAITFDAHLESLFTKATGVIAMGGYNTFCEVLSFDKPCIIVPRTVPRLEQFIRASRASELGLVGMLLDDDERKPEDMADAIRRLPTMPKPSEVRIPGLLDGLPTISANVDWMLAKSSRPPKPPLSVVRS